MKNKGLIIGIGAIVVITGLILVGVLNKKSSTVRSNNRSFSIEDTSTITKVFIANMFNNQVELTRQKEGGWIVDNTHPANMNTINILMETMNLMTIKSPVAKAKYDMVVRNMASTGIKVELYTNYNDTPEKVIYIGPSNQTHTGTYMMLENSNAPYLMHIEGFYGFLTPRFSPFANEWRNKLIVNLSPRDIKQVQVVHSGLPENDFVINRTIQGQVTLLDGKGAPVNQMDTLMAYDYLDRFKGLHFESWEENKTPMFIDSVRSSTPQQIIKITDNENQITTIQTFLKPLKQPIIIEDKEEKYDLDRMYAVINDKEFVVMQYFVLDPLTLSIDMFKKQ